MIYITGDIHSKPNERFSASIFPEQKEMTKDDFVIILGDFGLVLEQKETRTENYWLNWLESKPFTTLFVEGNHENFDRLDTYPVEEWNGGKVQKLRPSVIHLMRGQVFTIQGHKFFTFGGASSHDISDGILEPDDPNLKLKIKRLKRAEKNDFRIHHIEWWERELPNEEETKEGLENLKRHENKVDFILTHSPSTKILAKLGTDEYKPDCLTDYLQQILDSVEYQYHLFGHLHIEKRFPEQKAACLYKQITRIL